MNEFDPVILDQLLKGCIKKNRSSQQLLFKQFYGYSMNICQRYSESPKQARLILNDGFFKLFSILGTFNDPSSFKRFLAKILIHTALDHSTQIEQAPSSSYSEVEQPVLIHEKVLIQPASKELALLIQKLTKRNRYIFNLFIIDGFSHDEIAEILGISVEASESGLAQARTTLRKFLSKIDTGNYDRVTR
ncbi:RNA polymerase sigma factor [Dyadobacter bucti]|uniref:RNA polymerase sigma factor n=1 Tax=Dyadobacter bucti TaxID=2572203 RepID=UPI003F6F03F6